MSGELEAGLSLLILVTIAIFGIVGAAIAPTLRCDPQLAEARALRRQSKVLRSPRVLAAAVVCAIGVGVMEYRGELGALGVAVGSVGGLVAALRLLSDAGFASRAVVGLRCEMVAGFLTIVIGVGRGVVPVLVLGACAMSIELIRRGTWNPIRALGRDEHGRVGVGILLKHAICWVLPLTLALLPGPWSRFKGGPATSEVVWVQQFLDARAVLVAVLVGGACMAIAARVPREPA